MTVRSSLLHTKSTPGICCQLWWRQGLPLELLPFLWVSCSGNGIRVRVRLALCKGNQPKRNAELLPRQPLVTSVCQRLDCVPDLHIQPHQRHGLFLERLSDGLCVTGIAGVLQPESTFDRACLGRLVLKKNSLASKPEMRPSPSLSASANQASTVASGTPSTATPLLPVCMDACTRFLINALMTGMLSHAKYTIKA